MMPAIPATGTLARRRGSALLPALLIAFGLVLSPSWRHPAQAGEPTGAAHEAAGEPSFDLPPIAVQLSREASAAPRTVVVKAALVFDETDEDRINDSLRLAKTLLPKIMDSVITGVQGQQFAGDSGREAVNRVILERSIAVLQPYGVVVKKLRMDGFGGR